jgi:hypothetical protein
MPPKTESKPDPRTRAAIKDLWYNISRGRKKIKIDESAAAIESSMEEADKRADKMVR